MLGGVVVRHEKITSSSWTDCLGHTFIQQLPPGIETVVQRLCMTSRARPHSHSIVEGGFEEMS